MRILIHRFPEETTYAVMESPVGDLLLMASTKKLLAILFAKDCAAEGFDEQLEVFRPSESHSVLKKTKRQLKEYFEGERKSFDVPLEFHGTEFQKRVWRELMQVPYGQTKSYSEQSEKWVMSKR